MSNITELAQREKFEAWWERTQHNGSPPRFGWEYWREGEGYKVDDDDSELDGMWEVWKAASAELVEALESEKMICSTWRKTAKSTGEKLEKAQQRIIELVARKEKRLPVPYAYLRESDGQIQISIGAERPSDRSGGYATPWFPIYTATGIKVETK